MVKVHLCGAPVAGTTCTCSGWWGNDWDALAQQPVSSVNMRTAGCHHCSCLSNHCHQTPKWALTKCHNSIPTFKASFMSLSYTRESAKQLKAKLCSLLLPARCQGAKVQLAVQFRHTLQQLFCLLQLKFSSISALFPFSSNYVLQFWHAVVLVFHVCLMVIDMPVSGLVYYAPCTHVTLLCILLL